MSNSSGAGPTAPVLPLLLLAAMAAGSFYLYKKPFESTRPPAEEVDTSFAAEGDSVRARLWEDPFTAVAKHLEANSPSEDGGIERATDAALALTALQVLKVSESASANSGDSKNSSNKYDSLEERLLTTLRKEFDSDREPVSDQKFESLVKSISSSFQNHQVIVMPVMVRGGWYGEDVEQRRRRRYAVLSALGAAGYQPRYPERIQHFLWKKDEKPSRTDFVPYEWFNPDRTQSLWHPNLESRARMLVMWVTDDMLGDTPLSSLADLLGKL